MGNKKNASASVKKAQVSVGSVFGKFPKIEIEKMKQADRAVYSALVGSLAKDNNARLDIPLALNAQGKELFTIQKIARVFYAVSVFYDNKLSIEITEKIGLEADIFYTVTIARVDSEFALATRQPDKTELKVESSKKRTEKAKENKTKKENEVNAQVEQKAQALAKEQLEKQSNFLAQKINKAISARFKQWNIVIGDDKIKMLQNDIVAIIQNS